MNKRGVTLITLSIIVVIMAILVSAVVQTASDMNNEASKTKLQTEINQIEVLVANYIRRNSGNDLTPYEWDVTTISGFDTTQFEGEIITSNKIAMYVVDLEKIDAEEVNYGMLEDGETDRYLYSEQTGHVYYEKGKSFGSQKYYRVPDLEK